MGGLPGVLDVMAKIRRFPDDGSIASLDGASEYLDFGFLARFCWLLSRPTNSLDIPLCIGQAHGFRSSGWLAALFD